MATRRRWLLGLSALALGAGLGALSWPSPTLVARPEGAPPPTLIQNVRVVDVVAGTATAARDVWLEGGRIARISAHDPGASVPAGGLVIPGEGRHLVPGLIDMHCHVGSSPEPPWDKGLPDLELNLQRLLYSGVTRVFDPGAMVPDIFELRAAIEAGETLGPRLHAAGPVFTAPGGHPEPMVREVIPGLLVDYLIDGMTRQVDTEAGARAAVVGLMPHRPDFVKMAIDRIPLDAPRLEPKVAAAIVAAAREQEVRAVAHIGTYEDAVAAGAAGVRGWIHGVYKERLDEAGVAKLASFGIPMVPTMVVFDAYARMGRGAFASTALEREVASEELLASRIDRPADFEVPESSAEFLQMLLRERASGFANVHALWEAGVTILAGSDAQSTVVHGPALHRELGLLQQAGLPPAEVLRAATIYSARFLADDPDPPYGVIAAGKLADLVLVRSDPLESVEALADIEAVILGGRRLERTAWPR